MDDFKDLSVKELKNYNTSQVYLPNLKSVVKPEDQNILPIFNYQRPKSVFIGTKSQKTQKYKTDKLFDSIIKDAVKRGYDVEIDDDDKNIKNDRIKKLLPFSSSALYDKGINNEKLMGIFPANNNEKQHSSSMSVTLSSSLKIGTRSKIEAKTTNRCGIDPVTAYKINDNYSSKSGIDIRTSNETEAIEKIFLKHEKLTCDFEQKRNSAKENSSKQLLAQMSRDLENQSKQAMLISKMGLESINEIALGPTVKRPQSEINKHASIEGSSTKFCRMQIGLYKNEKEKEEALKHSLALEFVSKKSGVNIETFPTEKKKKLVEDIINLYNYYTEDVDHYKATRMNRYSNNSELERLEAKRIRQDINMRSEISMKNKQERIRLALQGPIKEDNYDNKIINKEIFKNIKHSIKKIDSNEFTTKVFSNNKLYNDLDTKRKQITKQYEKKLANENLSMIDDNEQYLSEEQYIKTNCDILDEKRTRKLELKNIALKNIINSNLFAHNSDYN